MKNLKLYGCSDTGTFYLDKKGNRLIISIQDDKNILLKSIYLNECFINKDNNYISADTIFHTVRINIEEDNFNVKVKRDKRKILNKKYKKIYFKED